MNNLFGENVSLVDMTRGIEKWEGSEIRVQRPHFHGGIFHENSENTYER